MPGAPWGANLIIHEKVITQIASFYNELGSLEPFISSFPLCLHYTYLGILTHIGNDKMLVRIRWKFYGYNIRDMKSTKNTCTTTQCVFAVCWYHSPDI